MTTDPIVLYTFISILVMLVLALAFIWFINRAQVKITESRLKEQELDMRHQKEMLLNTVKTKEKVRNRISKELHDDVSSQLGVINLNLYALKKHILDNDDALVLIDQIGNSLKASTERVRAISHELMPAMFIKFGIHDTFRELEANVNLGGEMNLSIEDDYLIKIKDNFKLLHIYRIVQELINNTIKYAKAKKVSLVFEESGMDVIMTYEDDGVGFDSEKLHQGLGISNIKTRVSLLEGEITIKSSIGNGYKTTIKFPNND